MTLDFLAALRRDGDAFAASCPAAQFDAPVDTCPGWTVADLLWHMTAVHHFWRTVVRDHVVARGDYTRPPRPAHDDLLATYRAGLVDTCTVLSAADPMDAVWTFSNDKTAGFVVRRVAHETAMHRWDAGHASGRDDPIEAELASDGIDEFLAHFLPRTATGAAAIGGSVHLHCTDVAGEWTVRERDDDTLVVAREHAKGDAALRGAASDLLLALWRRRPMSSVDVIGDETVAARFIAHTSLG